MPNRIDQTFSVLKRSRQKALIGYITAGFPTKASFQTLVRLCEQAGMNILEVGVPFSDPIADGPTIQRASQLALVNGVTLPWILENIKALRKTGCQLPIVLMSYCNPIQAMGLEKFFSSAHTSGVDGLIIPDLIPEEGTPFAKAASRNKLNLIYLVSPTTPLPRVRSIAGRTRGFLYAVSLTGVTGVQAVLPVKIKGFLKAVRRSTRKPVAVGFGITTPAQARQISRNADGVIIGSALVNAIEKSKSSRFQGAARFIRSLKGALHAS